MSNKKRFWTHLHKPILSLLLCLTSILALVGCGCEVGDFCEEGGVKGIVLSLDDEGNPDMLLSVDEAVNISADSAAKWAESLSSGWRLPTKEEFVTVKSCKSIINERLKNKGLPMLLSPGTFYWTSTECSPSHVNACGPDGIRCYFRTNASGFYRARAVYVRADKQQQGQETTKQQDINI